jgi:hypothetical protein
VIVLLALATQSYRVLEASGWPLDLNARALEMRYINFVEQALSLPPIAHKNNMDDELREALLEMVRNLFGSVACVPLNDVKFKPLKSLRDADYSSALAEKRCDTYVRCRGIELW